MIYYYLKKIDLFDKRVHLRINRQQALNTVEGVFCSLIFYIFSILILCYNIMSTYLQNTPIIIGTQLIRDLSVYEDIPKRAFKLSMGYHIFDAKTFALKLLKHKDQTTFKALSYLYMTKIQSSPFLFQVNATGEMGQCDPAEYGTQVLTDHVTCYNFNEDTYPMGGSTFQTGATIDYGATISVPICDLGTIFNTGTQTDYSEIKSTPDTSICDESGGNPTSTLVIGFNYSSDFVDIHDAIGFKSQLLSAYMGFDYTRQTLNVDFTLKKSYIETDPNYLYNIQASKTSIFYETTVSMNLVEKPEIDYNVNVTISYSIDYKKNMTYRSYNKVDNTLAASFSMIEVIFIFFEMFVHVITKTAVEFEIIYQMYYVTPKQHKNLIVEGIDSKGRRISLVKNNIDRITGNLIPPSKSKNLTKNLTNNLVNPNISNNPNIKSNGTENSISINNNNSFSSYSNSEYSSSVAPNNEVITVYREKEKYDSTTYMNENNSNSDNNNNNNNNNAINDSIKEVCELEYNNELNINNENNNNKKNSKIIRVTKKKSNNSTTSKSQNKTKIEIDKTFEIPSDNDSIIFNDNKNLKVGTTTVIDNFKLKLPKVKIKQVQSHTINPSSINSKNNLHSIRLANTGINSGRLTLLDSSFKTNFDNASEINLNIKNNNNFTDASKTSKLSKQSNNSNVNFERLHPDIVKSQRNYFVNQRAMTIDPLGQIDKKLNSINNVKRLHLHTGCVTFFINKCCSSYSRRIKNKTITQQKAVEIAHREIDIIVILKKLVEMEFLTKQFYIENNFNNRNQRRNSTLNYDNAFYYTNRNVNNAEEVFFHMDYKYFGSNAAFYNRSGQPNLQDRYNNLNIKN